MIIKNKKNSGKEQIALFEIFILIASITAFAYFVGAEFGVVSAVGPEGDCTSYYRGDKVIFTYGGRDYTVTSSTTIEGIGCDRGNVNCKFHKYTKQADGSWKRDDGSIVSVETEGATSYPTFLSLATAAATCYEKKNAGTDRDKRCENAGGICKQNCDSKDMIIVGDMGAQCNSPGLFCCKKSGSEQQSSSPDGVIPPIAPNIDTGNKQQNQTAGNETAGGFLGLGTTLGSIVEGFLWGAAVYSAMRFLILPFLGADESLTTAASMALGLGVWAGKTTYELLGGAKGAYALEKGIAVGIGVAAIVFALMYPKETR